MIVSVGIFLFALDVLSAVFVYSLTRRPLVPVQIYVIRNEINYNDEHYKRNETLFEMLEKIQSNKSPFDRSDVSDTNREPPSLIKNTHFCDGN